MPLNFTGTSRQRPIRTALSRFLTSKLRGLFEISEGQRPAEVFYPTKGLPVRMVDVELQDGIVIPKGSIVAAQSQHVAGFASETMPAPSGTVYSGISKTTSTALSENIDTSYFGYDQSVSSLLTIANGGIDVSGHYAMEQYSANDVTVATLNPLTGTEVTAAGTTSPGRRRNYPIGVVTADVYQDIRGKYLNYEQFDKSGVLCDWYIEVPFIISTDIVNNGRDNGSGGANEDYGAVVNKHGFLWANAIADLRPGALVKSDMFGKFMPQHLDSTFADSAALGGGTTPYYNDSDDENVTAQTVGRIITLDSRWPKDQLDLVDTYPDSEMPGTETAGLPSHLYNFLKDWLTSSTGSTPTKSRILDEVTTLRSGVARIQLMVS